MKKNQSTGFVGKLAASTALLALICMSSSPVGAAEEAEQVQAWQYELTPYLWATKMNGQVAAGNLPTTNVDMQFSDILKNLDFGLMLAFEARKQGWGVLLDGMYMKVSDSATSRLPGSNLDLSADVRIKQSMLAAALAYRVFDEPGKTALDVIGGLRYNKIDVNTQIDTQLLGLSGRVNRAGNKGWLDPYLGMRVIQPLNDKWHLDASFDLGGFGLGSDYAVQVQAGVSYAYSDTSTVKIGYRYMKMDYSDGDFAYNMANDGLYAGIGLRF